MKLKPETIKIILGLLPIPFIWAALSHFGALDKLKNDAMDWRFKLRGELVVDESLLPPLEPVAENTKGENGSTEEAEPRIPKIVYVDFDQRALASPEAGERPWDRAFFAKVARLLLDERVGARTIGYDFIFSSKSFSKMVPEENMFNSDSRIAELIKEYPDQIVLGANYTGVPQTFGNSRISSSAPMLYWKGYKAELNRSHPEAPTYPMIFYEGDKRYGRLGMLSADQLKSKGAIPRWAPLYFPYEGDAHAKLQLMGLQFAYPIEQKKVKAGETIKVAETKLKDAQNGHTRLQAEIQQKQKALEALEAKKPKGVLEALDKIKELEKVHQEKSAAVAQLETAIKANPAAAVALQAGLDKNKAERDAVAAQLDKYKDSVDENLVKDLEATKAKLQELEASQPTHPVAALEQLDALKKQLQAKQATVTQLEAAMKANPAAAAAFQAGLDKNKAERDAIQAGIKNLEAGLDPEFATKVTELRRKLANLQNQKPEDPLATLEEVAAVEKEYKEKASAAAQLLKSIQDNPGAAQALAAGLQQNTAARDAAEKKLKALKDAATAPQRKKVATAKAALEQLQAKAKETPALAATLQPAIDGSQATLDKETKPLEKLQAELDNAGLLLSIPPLQAELKTASDALKLLQDQAKANPAAAAAFQKGIETNTAKKDAAQKALDEALAKINPNPLIADFPETLADRKKAHEDAVKNWQTQQGNTQKELAQQIASAGSQHEQNQKAWQNKLQKEQQNLASLEEKASSTIQLLEEEWEDKVTAARLEIFKLQNQSEASALRIENAQQVLELANANKSTLLKEADRSQLSFSLTGDGSHWQLLDPNKKVLNSIPAKLESPRYHHISIALILSAYGLDWDDCKIENENLTITDKSGREIVNADIFGNQALEINWFSKWRESPEDIVAREFLPGFRDSEDHALFYDSAKTAILGAVKRATGEETSLKKLPEAMRSLKIDDSSMAVFDELYPKLSKHDGSEKLESEFDNVMEVLARLYRKSLPPFINSPTNSRCSIIDVFNYSEFYMDEGNQDFMEKYEERVAQIEGAIDNLQKQVEADPSLEDQAAPLFAQANNDLTNLKNQYKELAPDFQRAEQFFSFFKDAIVLVGPVDETFQDLAPTPFDSKPVPKVGVHGNLIKTMLTGKYITRPPANTEYVAIFLLSFLMIFLGVYTGPMDTMARPVAILTSFGYVGIAFLLFRQNHYVLPFVGPFGSAISCTFIGLAVKLIIEEKAKGRIKGMFGSYVSADLVEQMVESGEEPSLGGEEQRITAYFSDVQSFSAFSEKLTPTGLVDLMNEYLTAMTDILQEERGTLDKYIGDAIVAMYGAPIPMDDHAYQGVKTAVRMQMKQIELREKWKSEGDKWPDIVSLMQTRIGLNTGTATVGNMGALDRFNYTMMGDMVNLAARSESGAKAYGAYIMITEDCYHAAKATKDDIAYRYLDKIVVKGRTQPVEMYEVTGFWDHLDQEAKDCLDLFQQGIDNYLKQDWDKAESLFEKAMPLEPNKPGITPGVKDNPSHILIERVRAMRENPPGDDWDGVYIMTSK